MRAENKHGRTKRASGDAIRRAGQRTAEGEKPKPAGARRSGGGVDTYISKIENEKLDFAQFPGEELIHKLAKALEADEDELLLLARKIPDQIKKRVMERPDAFRKFADLNDKEIDRLLDEIDESDK